MAFDKFDVARLLSMHIKQVHPEWQTASFNPSQVARRIYWAADDAGVSRREMIAKKAEALAIQASEPMGEQAEPGLDGRRDVPVAEPEVAEPEAEANGSEV